MGNNNTIEITGVAISEFEFVRETFGERYYKFSIETERPSGVKDVLNLICSDRDIDIGKKINGKTVSIIGKIRTRNDKSDGTNHVIVNIYVDEMYVLDIENISGYDICDLTGFICKNSGIRTTPLNRIISDVILAVHREYGSSDYVPCVFWGKNAKYIATLPVGTKISLTGRLQSRNYIKNNEQKTVYEVSVQKFEVVE